MLDLTQLVQLMQQQMEAQQKQHQQQMELVQKQIQQQTESHMLEKETLVKQLTSTPDGTAVTHPVAIITRVSPFDPNAELWKDNYARFNTFAGAHAIPEDRLGRVFLTNQTTKWAKVKRLQQGRTSTGAQHLHPSGSICMHTMWESRPHS